MARPLRIELEGGMHHVVSHGNGRLWVFRNDNQRRYFLNLLGSSAFKYRVVIHAFVLMTNHVHILVKTPLPNLNQFMRKLLSDYALYYNKWYRRRGSVFKSRYGSFLIQENNYYLTVVKYICDNPGQNCRIGGRIGVKSLHYTLGIDINYRGYILAAWRDL